MRSARSHPLVRLFALVLIAWLGVDSLARGSCPHDLVVFERTGHAQLGGSSSHDHSDSRDDVNHCSCHWQYLPAVTPACVVVELVQPVSRPPRVLAPQAVARRLDHPPQRFA
jgi:hypothetical protein